MNIGDFNFYTYKSRNDYIAIHAAGCENLLQHGGDNKDKNRKYSGFMSFEDARIFADATGLEVKICSMCNPK